MMQTDEPRYLAYLEVVAIHDALMERTGSEPAPLRSEDQLRSSLMRPRIAAHYEGADLIQQAALLAVGISQAQTFLDGNKPTAFAAADVFLRLNGLAFTGDPVEMVEHLDAAAVRGNPREAAAALAAWLRDRVEPWDRNL